MHTNCKRWENLENLEYSSSFANESNYLADEIRNSNKPGHSGVRNRNHNRRSGSPNLNLRSNSPTNHHHKRRSPMRNPIDNGNNSNKLNEKESPLKDCNKQPIEEDLKDNNVEPNENMTNEKIERENEDELLASSDSENSDDDDGIDLFASEESESENEGRFKLSSSKIERKTNVPVVSFSELGKTTTAPADVLLRDLDELQTDTNPTHRRGGGGGGGGGGARRENDRHNRNRRDDRGNRYNRDRERDRENRDRERERDRRDRDRVRDRERESSKPKLNNSWKNSKNEDSRKKDEPAIETNGKGDRKLFKSTFTSVDNNKPKSKSPDAGKKT